MWAWNNLYEHILNHIFDERRRLMQTAVVTLLLVVSAVLFACIVVEYAVSIFEQTLQTQNMPCMDRQNKRTGRFNNQSNRQAVKPDNIGNITVKV